MQFRSWVEFTMRVLAYAAFIALCMWAISGCFEPPEWRKGTLIPGVSPDWFLCPHNHECLGQDGGTLIRYRVPG